MTIHNVGHPHEFNQKKNFFEPYLRFVQFFTYKANKKYKISDF